MSFSSEIKKGVACDSAGKPDSVFGRAVCLSVHPGKMILFPFRHWFDTKYKGRYKFDRAMFALDLFLIGVAVTLAVLSILAFVFLHTKFEDKITFDATVAPREVVTGAPSTLVIRYTNGTNEELRNTEVTLTFPKHFLLQKLSGDEAELTSDDHLVLGTVPVGATGVIHIQGVMFGDVGGQQSFQSKMTFVHGKPHEERFGTKTDTQTFSPVHSALSLSLELPDRLIASQTIEGIIRYKNTAEIEFPVVSILPQWPKGFTFLSADVKQASGQFEIDTVKPGESGQMHFKGVLQDSGAEATFAFDPSFTFGEDRYKQETLTHTASIVPLPITIEHSVKKETLQPGDDAIFTVTYKNISDQPVKDVIVGIESDSPFFKTTPVFASMKDRQLKTIVPGDSRTVEIHVPLKSSIAQSQTSTYEHLTLRTRPIATYTMIDNPQPVTSKGSALESRLTTPIVFESFARYRTASGDQLGRGPLPPKIGKETTYWIFWHIDGTTNELTNVHIEGTLPMNVRFTGKQTVSQSEGVTYDPGTRKIIWTANSVSPTLAPTSKILGIAFELGVTPTDANKTPVLLKDVQVTAVDGWTGGFVSAQVSNVLAVGK